MTKRITITDTEYFKILELKGKYGENGLCGLLVLLDKLAGYAKEANIDKQPKQPDITIKPEQPEQPINPSDIVLKEWIKSERSPDIKNQKNQKG